MGVITSTYFYSLFSSAPGGFLFFLNSNPYKHLTQKRQPLQYLSVRLLSWVPCLFGLKVDQSISTIARMIAIMTNIGHSSSSFTYSIKKVLHFNANITVRNFCPSSNTLNSTVISLCIVIGGYIVLVDVSSFYA